MNLAAGPVQSSAGLANSSSLALSSACGLMELISRLSLFGVTEEFNRAASLEHSEHAVSSPKIEHFLEIRFR